jgi:dephospho-CoA kinase
MTAGIAGYMGSGKTTAASYFSDRGAVVINADHVAKEIMNSNAGIKKQLVSAFGKEIILNGQINFAFLGKVAFGCMEKILALNSIVHPQVLSELKKRICQDHGDNMLMLDAALISFWKIESWFDRLYWIKSSFDNRFKRLTLKHNLPENELCARMKLQEKLVKEPCTKQWETIFNNSTLKQFEMSLSDITWENIR